MRRVYLVLMLIASLSTQSLFAHEDNYSSDSKSCAKIASACKDAGYKGKEFWSDCMKPIILGKTVKDVTINSDTVKTCRADKIAQLKKELKEFQKAH